MVMVIAVVIIAIIVVIFLIFFLFLLMVFGCLLGGVCPLCPFSAPYLFGGFS